MTAGKGQRLTRADERAFARLLAQDDDDKVMCLWLAIGDYERIASGAKARLGKRNILAPRELWWQGGYRAGMAAVIDVINEMAEVTASPREILSAVAEVALAAGELAYATCPWRDEGAGPVCAGDQ